MLDSLRFCLVNMTLRLRPGSARTFLLHFIAQLIHLEMKDKKQFDPKIRWINLSASDVNAIGNKWDEFGVCGKHLRF